MSAARRPSLLVDAHVHFHDCFDAARFVDGAAQNFAAGARGLGLSSETPGCLLFAESAWEHHFRFFRDRTTQSAPAGWRFERTGDDCSLLAEREDGKRLWFIAGRQIVTREALEVLALGVDGEFPDGLSLQQTLDEVRDSGALPVLPWGFGKWLFSRGALVRQLLEQHDAEELFVGDNGGRLRLAGPPRLLEFARGKGIGILPGTDPLPFPRANRSVGSYGCEVRTELDRARPTWSILSGIRSQGNDFVPFGHLEGLVPFCRDQIGMQLLKRGRD